MKEKQGGSSQQGETGSLALWGVLIRSFEFQQAVNYILIPDFKVKIEKNVKQSFINCSVQCVLYIVQCTLHSTALYYTLFTSTVCTALVESYVECIIKVQGTLHHTYIFNF